ncbi:MAG: tetratricopeptide repeat protein [Gemmataceae bacterium]
MSNVQNTNDSKGFVPPSPDELMARYIQRRAEAHVAGIASTDVSGEVQPYDAGPVQPMDPKPAWDMAVIVVREFVDEEFTWTAPPEWPDIVSSHEPAFDLAFCLGNFPQLVRNLQPLLQAQDLTALRQSRTTQPTEVPELEGWAREEVDAGKVPSALLAIGALRLAKQFALASELASSLDEKLPGEWRAVWENEKAALAWHRGDVEEAYTLWQKMPESLPVLFNRGMAGLFLGKADEARANLQKAVEQLPETSAWHYLAKLYLTLAQTR